MAMRLLLELWCSANGIIGVVLMGSGVVLTGKGVALTGSEYTGTAERVWR